jgi:AraC-like DNA-binding protein
MGLLTLSLVLILNSFTYIDGFYYRYPHLWRSGIFTQYLVPPLFYLYVRATLKNEITFCKWDWIHFVPAILHFIEFIPFYLTSEPEKLAYISYIFSHPELLSQQKEGILPGYLHPILKSGVGVFYVALQVCLLVRFYKIKFEWLEDNRIVWNWLKRLTFLHSLTYVFILFFFLFYRKGDMRTYSILPLGIIQFFSAITLVFNPSVLYGIIRSHKIIKNIENEDKTDPPSKKFSLSCVKNKEYKRKLELFIDENKPYLVKNYSIRQLAADCDIPVHHLSIVINREYGMSYTDFINRYRIDFIIAHRYNEYWVNFSLEGLSFEAGFNSRSSFINAFKKAKGQTPSDYFEKNKLNMQSSK